MSEWLTVNEPVLRGSLTLALFVVLALWELWWPRRGTRDLKRARWLNNLGIGLIDSLILRALFPLAAVGVALHAEQQGWGLLALVSFPAAIEVVIAVLALDLLIYWQHRLFHAVPVLWRLHRVHHTDLDLDVTSAVRFHPVEIVLSMLIKFAAVAALGAPALAVLVFEVLLGGTALFNHANINLSGAADRVVRWLVVTPDMHRVHHSVVRRETDSNFSFNFPWWDRLFGSYRAQPAAGHMSMDIGVPQVRQRLSLYRLLLLPFLRRNANLA